MCGDLGYDILCAGDSRRDLVDNGGEAEEYVIEVSWFYATCIGSSKDTLSSIPRLRRLLDLKVSALSSWYAHKHNLVVIRE